MKTLLRLFAYLRPYGHRLAVLALAMLVFAVLSGVSLTLIPPFLRILFDDVPESRVELTVGKEVLPGQETGGKGELGLQAKSGDGERTRDEAGGNGVSFPRTLESKGKELKRSVESWLYRGDPLDRLFRFCVLFMILVLVKNLFGYLKIYQVNWLDHRIQHTIRTRLMDKYQRLPLDFFDRTKAGHLISRVTNDVTLMRGAIVGGFVILTQNTLLALFALVLIFVTSWKLSLLALAVLPFNSYLVRKIGKRLRRKTTRFQECMADMTSVLHESITGIRVVKAFRMEAFETRRFENSSYGYFRNYLKMRMTAELATPLTEILASIGMVVVLGYGGRLVLDQQLHPANLIMFIAAMLWVISPVKALANLNSVLQEGLSAAHRVFDILDRPAESEAFASGGGSSLEGSKAITAVPFEASIRFERVDFEYAPGIPVLRDIDLEVRRGETVAFVGPSGAGKSTLVDLVPRFYQASSGRILIDERDIREFPLSSLRALMGIVTQETILFNDSVRNNIAYGLGDCPQEKLEEAAKAANAHEFILELPEGYDTVIGDRGQQLSGGQRQRLAIARGLLKDPEILILDEATSSLDLESERLVQEAIERLMSGRTNFVIAHRLSTIRHADKIVVMDGGRIQRIGTHEELVDQEGIYQKYFELQSGAA